MTRAEVLIDEGRRRLLASAERFSRRGDEREQARELLEHAAGRAPRGEIDDRTRRRFESYIERRAAGEPVAYIRGFEEFLGMRLAVGPGAFVPRQSTEYLATQAIRKVPRRHGSLVADLATGVGAVALAVARKRPDATVYGTDVSQTALRLARANARTLELGNVRFLRGSMYDPLPRKLRGSFDVIASHPPYIATTEVADLPDELKRFEPIASLTDRTADGLGLVRTLVAGDWLRPGGWLCVEIGVDLARTLRAMLTRAGYRDVRSTHGVHRTSRVLVAKR